MLLADVSAEDLAYSNLRFFSEYCWRNIADQKKNGGLHDEWYGMLQGDDRPRRLHIQAAREHAKTTCLSVKYTLWRVGRNHDLRVMVVSQSATLATTILREIRQHIEDNERLRAVFPSLRPSIPWTGSELQVKRGKELGAGAKHVIMKDPTFVGIGLGGSLTGKRADLIIVDDPFDATEVQTKNQRQKVVEWIEKKLIPTLTPDGEIVFVGTPWHYDDYWSHLEGKDVKKGGMYVIEKYPAIKNYEPGMPIEEWDVQWPEVWSAKKLAERKEEIGSIRFNCLYLLDPSGLEGALFKKEWLTYFDPKIFSDSGYIQGFEYYVGVDPNVSDNPESARLGIVTVAFDRPQGDMYVLDMYAEAVDFPTQIKKIVEYGVKNRVPFIPREVSIRKVGIEANAWQQAVSKDAYVRGLPVQEIKQKQTKVERILGLQPHFENGRIRFPDPDKIRVNWWDKFEAEYLSYPMGKYKDLMDALELAFTTADVIRDSGGPNFAFGPPPGFGRIG